MPRPSRARVSALLSFERKFYHRQRAVADDVIVHFRRQFVFLGDGVARRVMLTTVCVSKMIFGRGAELRKGGFLINISCVPAVAFVCSIY